MKQNIYWEDTQILFTGSAESFIYGESRSSRSQMFFKIGLLQNFSNFTGKHLGWSLFLIKLQT